MDPQEIEIIMLLGGILGSLVALLVFILRGSRDAKEAAYHAARANHAVNNIPDHAPNLYDQVTFIKERVQGLVEAQEDFAKRGWQTLPDDIGTAARLTETIRDLQHHDERIDEKLDTIITELRSHVEWEETQKYSH